ncbi:MAG: sensor domain-containing diguanylate cyclase, partial [Armatimonadota bacterium]|nr:sensor domain-containing diguanylate cyclase [Armatimonadota bacterium]
MLALVGLPICWWLTPAPVPPLLALPLLFLLTLLTMLFPVGRLGTRPVRLGSAAVLYTALLYGACVASLVSLFAGWTASQLRRRGRGDVRLYAPTLALSVMLGVGLYHYARQAAPVAPASWVDGLRLLGTVATFLALRVLLLWWGEGGGSAQRTQIARVEGMVEAVTLPTVLAALWMQQEWGWLSVLPACAAGAAALVAARALVQTHQAYRQIRALQTLHRRLIAHLHPDQLMQDLADEMRRLVGFDRLSLWSYARQEAHLQVVGVYPAQHRADFPAYLEVEGILSKVVDHRKPLLLTEELWQRLQEQPLPFVGHLMVVPLAVYEYPWGLLILERRTQHEPFVQAEYETIRVIVEHLAILLENLRLYRQTAELAVRDGLTGLLNHRRLQERLKEELARSLRYYHPMTLLMIDVDYFKRYNDTYGHQQGDELLRRLAQVLQRNVRQSDIVGRWGGE